MKGMNNFETMVLIASEICGIALYQVVYFANKPNIKSKYYVPL